VKPINLKWPLAREEGVMSPLTRKWRKVLKPILVLFAAFLIFGCANHKTTRQLEIEYYEIMAKRSNLILERLKSDYKECDKLYKTERPNYLLLKECYERAEKYSLEEMKRLDDDIKKYEDWKRHQELMDAIRRR
jgi:hypothetical protein